MAAEIANRKHVQDVEKVERSIATRIVKILYCHNIYTAEGGENTVFRQETQILQAHGEVVRTFTRNSNEIAHYNAAAKAGAFVFGFYSMRTQRELTQTVEEFRPDVALVQNVFPLLSPSVYLTLHRLRVPVVQLIFNYRLVCINGSLFRDGALCERCVRGSVFNAIPRRCLHGSLGLSVWYAMIFGMHRTAQTFRKTIDRVVVPHGFVGRKIAEAGIDPSRIRINPNPFTLPKRAEGESAEPFILYVGRVIPEKGVLSLVRAMESVPPPVRLVIVGDGEEMPAIKAFLEGRPALAARIDMPGRMWGDQLHALENGALAHVLPSQFHDISPVFVYTALGLGKPVIVSDLGSLPEMVGDGVEGLVFRAGDSAGLAAKINELAANPALRRKLGDAGRRKAEEQFAPEVHYRRLRAVFEEVVS